jgi:RNA polymerase sigma factor (sigma-70 family)
MNLIDANNDAFVRGIIAGDPSSFAQLFDFIVPKLVRHLHYQFGISEADAEELAADAMIKVRNAVAKFDPEAGAKLTTWVFRIAENHTKDFLRRRAKLAERADFASVGENQHILEGSTVKDWSRKQAASQSLTEEKANPRQDAFAQAFSALSQDEQDILRLREVMEYEHIAELEEVGVGALRVRHKRAMDRLRDLLQQENGNER